MKVKNVFIKHHDVAAGKWIYEGYKNAWESLGYTTHYYNNLEEIKNFNEKYYLMCVDAVISNSNQLSAMEKSEKTFLFINANSFPDPWGRHPNFQCHCPDHIIKSLNNMGNVFYWTFDIQRPEDAISYHKWEKDINTVPLAYDSMSYKPLENNNYAFDICYVGGRANNGFDEKYKIMLNYFKEFQHANLKVGIFIDKNLSHEQENMVLFNSKVCLNIHDNYQRILATSDTNERTFKSLGCNGIMVSDREGFIPKHFPDLPVCDSPQQMLEWSQHYLQMHSDDLELIRDKYRNLILENHTYINRVKAMLSFKNS